MAVENVDRFSNAGDDGDDDKDDANDWCLADDEDFTLDIEVNNKVGDGKCEVSIDDEYTANEEPFWICDDEADCTSTYLLTLFVSFALESVVV